LTLTTLSSNLWKAYEPLEEEIMAVPKRKTSKSKRDSRRAHEKASVPEISECPQCHQPKLPHRVCRECGYYNGRQVFEVE
jgi:large subunit ribosomal protein L32